MTLKIIGAGYGRTGTASLKLALETLGFGPCYHMSEVLGNAGHVDHWLNVAAGKPDWDTIFANYQSTVDFPASNYWRELAAYYPDAKIILSLRDAERWVESTQKTIFSKTLQGVHRGTKWGKMLDRTTQDPVCDDINDREKLINAFNNHNDAVKAAFGPDRLLVFEAKDGWDPLCAFLGVSVPADAYPRVNSGEEFDAVFEMLKSPVGAAMMNGEGMGGASAHEELFKE